MNGMTTETTASEFAHVIETIASSLGVAAERIFEVFVNTQTTIGILNLMSLLVALVVTYLVWRVSHKEIASIFKDDNDDWKCNDSWFSAAVIQFGIAAISFGFASMVISGIVAPSILKITCPEYTAMKEIIELVRP